MTLGRLSALASAALALGSLALLIATGSLLGVVGLLAAPLPALLGLLSDWADRRVGDLLLRRAGDADVERLLDDALALPVETAPPDDAYLLPGLPRTPDDT